MHRTEVHVRVREIIPPTITRVGPDIRQCRIIRADIRYPPRKSRFIRHIQQGIQDNTAGYLASIKATRSGTTLTMTLIKRNDKKESGHEEIALLVIDLVGKIQSSSTAIF